VLVGLHYEIDAGDDGAVVTHHVDVAQLDDRSGAHGATLPRREDPERGKVASVSDAERIEREFEAVTGLVATGSTPLAGGASRVTWEVRAEGRRFVVQAARGDTARDMLGEFELLRALAAEGLPVAEPIAAGCPDGRAILVSASVAGETLGGRVLRTLDESGRAALARDFAKAAADIHRVGTTSVAGLAVAAEPIPQVDAYREVRLTLAPDRPVLALAERWLRDHPPEAAPTVLCHGDLRLGNLIIEDGTLRAVIDWELAHLGHPAEDLGWSCVRAWRFGGHGAALGCVDRETLRADYERFGGSPVSADTLRHHEVLGTWKWGLMCLLQAEAHLSGVVNDLEMLAIGRRVVENEYDLLRLLGWRPNPNAIDERGAEIRAMGRPVASSADGLSGSGTGIVPGLGALKDALVGDSAGESSDYRRRLQRSVSEMVARETSVAPRLSARRVERLIELGAPDHGRLAEEISSGERIADGHLLDLLGDEVLDQILVVNPAYVGRVDDVV
jgi:aminoglycoside phosphotransferase (APT) family kinase protein